MGPAIFGSYHVNAHPDALTCLLSSAILATSTPTKGSRDKVPFSRTNPKALRTHNMRLLGPKTILY